MTDKDLRKLTRADLLEMLLEQSKELEETRAQLEAAQKALENRKIKIEHAGSLAEAALQLNGVFEAAQKAADQYLENITQIDGDAAGSAALAQTEERCRAMEAEAQARCRQMLEDAKREVARCWDVYSQELRQFYGARMVFHGTALRAEPVLRTRPSEAGA